MISGGGRGYVPNWLDLDGLVNVRDLGGVVATDGRIVREHRLLRSDNLQDLPDATVRWLVDEAGLTDVVDLRTGVERTSSGPGPMTRESAVTIHPLSLYPDDDADERGIPDVDDAAREEQDAHEHPDEGAEPETGAGAETDDGPALPWQDDPMHAGDEQARHGFDWFLAQHYLLYLERRPDNVLAALRAIAQAPGAALVHCAAGKDRTGMIVAFALSQAGVDRQQVIGDYHATQPRVQRIIDRLVAMPTYAVDMAGQTPAEQATPRAVMAMVLDTLDADHGGVSGWLRTHGWTDADQAALESHLFD